MGRAPRTGKVEQSKMVLEATSLAVAAMLGLWLLSWWLIRPAARGLSFASLRVSPAGVGLPVIPFQREDAAALGAGPAGGDAVRAADLAEELRRRLEAQSGGVAVAFVSAPAATWGGKARLIEPEDPLGDGADAADLLKAAAEGAKGRPALIILDAAPLASDRNLGFYGSGAMSGIRDRAAEILKGTQVLVLASCAPGQRSWAREEAGRTAFADFAAKGLEGGAKGWDPGGDPDAITAQGLGRYVAAHVSAWAAQHRKAVQTPLLLPEGTEANFRLPKLATSADAEAAEESKGDRPSRVAPLAEQHKAAWAAHEKLGAGHPGRLRPAWWRQRTEAILRVERQALGTVDGLTDLSPRFAELSAEPAAVPGLGPLPEVLALASADDLLRSAERRGIRGILGYLIGDPALLPSAPKEKPPAPGPGEPAKGDADAKAKGEEKPEGSQPPASAEAPASPSEDPGGGASAGGQAVSETREARELRGAVAGDPSRFGRIEKQLLSWALAFQRLRGGEKPDELFRGVRAAALRRAVELRTGPLQAADGEFSGLESALQDPEILAWVDPFVRRADAHRRRAQDALFLEDASALESADAELAAAESAAGSAREAASSARSASATLERIQVEVPYYAEWKSRDEDVTRLSAVLDAAERLAAAWADPPGRQQDPTDEDIRKARERSAALRSAATSARDALDELARELMARANNAAANAVPAMEIDGLLRVPFLPADLRSKLFLKAGAAAPQEVRVAAGTAPPQARPDPSLVLEARRLARTELTLAKVAGAPPELLKGLDDALLDAARSGGDSPAAWESVTDRARALRRAMAESSAPEAEAADDLAVRVPRLNRKDRQARGLPVLWASAESADRTARDSAMARRADLLAFHAGRLVEDYAPEAALDALRAAGELRAPDLERLDARADALASARLTAAIAPGLGSLSGWDDLEGGLRLDVSPGRDAIPSGRAVAWIEGKGAIAMPIDPATRQPVAATVALPPRPGSEVRFALSRREAAAGEVGLTPHLFYRGRSAAVGEPAAVEVAQVKAPVTLALEEDFEAVAAAFNVGFPAREQVSARDLTGWYRYADQFRIHPREGYLLPHMTIYYRLRVKNTSEPAQKLNIQVDYGLEGESTQTYTGTLDPEKEIRKGREREGIAGLIPSDAIPEKGSKVFVATVRKVSNGRAADLLGELRVTVRMLKFNDLVYARVVGFDSNWDRKAAFIEGAAPTAKFFHVEFWHKSQMLLPRPIYVTARCNGQERSFYGYDHRFQSRLTWKTSPPGGGVIPGGGWHFWFPRKPEEKAFKWEMEIPGVPGGLPPGEFSGEVAAPADSPASPMPPDQPGAAAGALPAGK